LHALADAILGATGGRDIGFHFPNTDERWRDAVSIDLLSAVWSPLFAAGWRINNVDMTILLEAPQVGPSIAAMKERISNTLQCSPDDIGIKATTTEKLGAIGRGEGVLASAVVLISKDESRLD
jgi:2-C-methyl-D-erythritol 2,4-cyclodiphosphate synthase